MFITDMHLVGEKLYNYRRSKNMTQAQAAECSGLSERAYADIERGSVCMRADTMIRICSAFHIMPNDLFTDSAEHECEEESELLLLLKNHSPHERRTALRLLTVYLSSLE